MESGVVGEGAWVAGEAAGAAGFSSGFSCAKPMDVEINTAAIVSKTNDARRLRQGKAMEETS